MQTNDTQLRQLHKRTCSKHCTWKRETMCYIINSLDRIGRRIFGPSPS